MAVVIDGLAISNKIREKLAEEIANLGYTPSLAVVLVSDDPASAIYVKRKAEACKGVGIHSILYDVERSIWQSALEKIIASLNDNYEVDGILIQLPLPPHIDRGRVFSLLDPEKDVDVLTPYNVGLLVQGRPKMLPCTPHGISLMLTETGLSVEGKNVVVINRSDIVGKPLSSMLIQDNPEYGNATVTVCHVKTPFEQLKRHCLNADMIVVAVGITGFLTPDMVREGQVIIDVGINRPQPRVIVGDVADGVAEKVGWITPVPGGVGPMTVTGLLLNTVQAAQFRRRR